jgi:hypothetical protein
MFSKPRTWNTTLSGFTLDPVAHSDIDPLLRAFMTIIDAMPSMNILECRYGYGKFAWMPAPPFQTNIPRVIIDDIKTRLRRIYTIPGNLQPGHGYLARVKAVGDRLVVVSLNRTACVFRCPINERKNMLTIYLPASPWI